MALAALDTLVSVFVFSAGGGRGWRWSGPSRLGTTEFHVLPTADSRGLS